MVPPRSPDRAVRSDASRNRERLVRAAVAAYHRDGVGMTLTAVASEAGVGIGTLYRHFATREELLDELTLRSFEQLLGWIGEADEREGSAAEALRAFLTAVITHRDELVLPSTGGPAVREGRARAAQQRLHEQIAGLLARGARDGSVVREVAVWDVAWLGATLAPPGRTGAAWEGVAARLLDTYVAGLGVPRD